MPRHPIQWWQARLWQLWKGKGHKALKLSSTTESREGIPVHPYWLCWPNNTDWLWSREILLHLYRRLHTHHRDLHWKAKKRMAEKPKNVPQSCPHTIRPRPAHTKTAIGLQIGASKSEGWKLAYGTGYNLWALSALVAGRKRYVWKDREDNNGHGASNDFRRRYWRYPLARK